MLEICKSARKENNHLHLLKRVRRQYYNSRKREKKKVQNCRDFLVLLVRKFAIIAKTAISIIPPLKANSASGISVAESAPTAPASRSKTTTSPSTTRVIARVVPSRIAVVLSWLWRLSRSVADDVDRSHSIAAFVFFQVVRHFLAFIQEISISLILKSR